jgi:intracellular multiplication protein IcmL
MPDDIFEVIKSRHNYYRDNYRRLVVVLIVLLAINGILIGVICYQFATMPDPECFATTADGRIIPILPLNQ